MRAKNVAAGALIQRTLKLLSLLLIGQSFLIPLKASTPAELGTPLLKIIHLRV